MEPRRPKKILQKDKDLVAEQSGMTWLGAGLLLAFLLGFSIRGLIHPQKIQALVAQAAAGIHKDLEVKFESAEVSLADGAFPRFSVVVRNIVMSSENKCWMRPRLEIDQLELPLSLISMLTRGSPIATVHAQNVKLVVLGEKRDCTVSEKAHAPAVPLAANQAVSLVKSSAPTAAGPPALEQVTIQRLEVDPVYYPQGRTELTDVELTLKSHQPQIVVLKAKSNILKDPQWGEYAAHAQISVEYSEFPEKNVEAHVFGNWREGSYSWHTSYKIEDGFFQTEADLRHIPLSKLAGVSPNTALSRFENMKQVWVSLKAKAVGHNSKLPETPVQVDQFKIEGDSGDLEIEKLEWAQISDKFPKPFLVQMKGLSLQTLLKISSQASPSPILNEMGTFTGRAEVDDQENLKVIGELEGLQFVFANKGQREYQTIRRMSLDLGRERGAWNLNVSRLEPDQGVFNGELSARGDSELKDVSVKLIAEQMSFAPAVQKLMTGGGSLGTFQSRINLGFKNGILDRLQGKFTAENLDIESFKMPKLTLQFVTDPKEGFTSQLQIPELNIPASYVDSSFLATLKQFVPLSEDNEYELKQFRSQVKLRNFKSMKWRAFSFAYDKGGQASGQAEWNEAGQLSGQLALKSGSIHKFVIEGTRDKPLIRLENDRTKSAEVSTN